ncbi:MAG: DegQ family serine endoprotease [Pyrinomonas methylaliphatogenes]|nr:DegQ family serine endoprotease [Pyrinomonas methylaliphatogenes]
MFVRAKLGLFLAILLLIVACSERGASSRAATAVATPPVAAPVAQTSYADVVARVAPAVVTITAERRVRVAQQFPFFDDPFFREFFGFRNLPQEPRTIPEEALGSGVIVSPDGYILTNHHVIDGAEEIRVELSDKRVFKAKVVGSDPPSDLAVLKIEAHNLPVLPLGDSDKARVGDVVLAIGNPLGLEQTVTMGIISAKGRATSSPGSGSFEDFIQTDAPINRGNSGGALVNTNGELIGINSQIVSPTGGNIGIGFAIPSNMAKNVMEQLIKTGTVRRGKLGVGIQPVTADIAESLKLREVRGAIVNSVEAGSPAERAGIRVGDVILAVNGTPVNDSNDLRNRIASFLPGTEVTLTIWRNGREEQVRVRLAELQLPNQGRRRTMGGGDQNRPGGRLGIVVEPLTPELAARYGIRGQLQGLIVADVDPDGPAAQAGIRPGDVIQEANRQPVRTPAELESIIRQAGDHPVLLLVARQNPNTGEAQTFFLPVRPQ